MRHVLWLALLTAAAACQSSAYADRPPRGPEIAIDSAPVKQRAPYDVQIVREDGQTLPTYGLGERFYVEGTSGQRYSIRVSNPTARRVEAVISVDGLDVVDGENGDLKKRGYIVPAYGSLDIEGFRTSLSDVASFRFSSVDGSYAGLKGKPRNVGVIAVAIFEEIAPPPEPVQIIGHSTGNYDYRDDLDGAGAANSAQAAKSAPPPPASPTTTSAPAPVRARVAQTGGPSGGGGRATTTTAAAPAEAADSDEDGDGAYDRAPAPSTAEQPTHRAGLGTQYGEARSSAASYTLFERSGDHPVAIAELRYNDAAGLVALGIPLRAMPDEYEIMTRETAQPFPGDRFAQPPR